MEAQPIVTIGEIMDGMKGDLIKASELIDELTEGEDNEQDTTGKN